MTLTCEQARALASELIDGELDDDVAASVSEHVAGCPSCPQLYRSMVLVHAHLREHPGPPAPAETAALASIRARLRTALS